MREPASRSEPSGAENFEVILFDLGGVLVMLEGIQSLLSWADMDEASLWERWLISGSVRDFESGRISPVEFAKRAVAEFDLPNNPEAFLDSFRAWTAGLYPGVEALLCSCGRKYRLGCLSNTNPIHWPIMRDDFGLGSYLEKTFISYEIGLLKPDEAIYRYVLERLAVQPDRILYFDDNPLNVGAAAACGIAAHVCRGGDELRKLVTGLVDC